ncbi:MAG: M14 family zinc carboxypeptidase [Pseudomonadota bacterium]
MGIWRMAVSVLVTLTLSCGLSTARPISEIVLPDGRYDDAITTPDEHLGFGLGDHPVRHHQLVSYMNLLADESDRITVEEIGRTHERRPILLLTVTSPKNHDDLDTIRERHLASLDGEALPEDAPAILWMNYGVHGAESASMDAVIPAAYHFAAAQGRKTEQTLENAVILLVAVLNPDGHARRTDHVDTFSGAVPVTDPAHEQHQLWTEARTNHYWFDLNRQWLLATQPEARAWIKNWHRWKPQVTTDFHEMGSNATYYFHPGEPKRLNPLIPEQSRALAKGIAEHHRTFFDSEARLYYTEERFDNFYVGKGSTYPQVNGSVGILFEVGAARGGLIESSNGLRDYADNIRAHFRTTLSTIDGALAEKEAIAGYHRGFFQRAREEAAQHPIKAYVFTTNGDRTRLGRFLDVLQSHDIAVHRLSEPVEIGEQNFTPDGAFVVSLDQDQYRMIRGIFNRVTEFEEAVFYDVSGWTLPLAYDLDYAALGLRPDERRNIGRFTPGLLGDVLPVRPHRASATPPPKATYGYIIPWTDHLAPKAAYRLLNEGLMLRAATKEFSIRTTNGVESFAAGTLFVPLSGQTVNPAKVHVLARSVAAREGIPVVAAVSGGGDASVVAVGGPSFRSLTKPSVLLLMDGGTSRYDVGEVWHLLDNEMEIPVTIRRMSELNRMDWSRYTHIILPGGNARLDDYTMERVTQWIKEEGGTLIALRHSAIWAQSVFTDTEHHQDVEDGEDEVTKERTDYGSMQANNAEHVIGGAIVATDLDPSHPLGFGYADRFLPAHRNITSVLNWPQDNPYAVVSAYPAQDIVLSGYVSDKRQAELAGTPAVIAEPLGNGHLILMADNPVFRGTFLGTNKLLLNSLFFSDAIVRPITEEDDHDQD